MMPIKRKYSKSQGLAFYSKRRWGGVSWLWCHPVCRIKAQTEARCHRECHMLIKSRYIHRLSTEGTWKHNQLEYIINSQWSNTSNVVPQANVSNKGAFPGSSPIPWSSNISIETTCSEIAIATYFPLVEGSTQAIISVAAIIISAADISLWWSCSQLPSRMSSAQPRAWPEDNPSSMARI